MRMLALLVVLFPVAARGQACDAVPMFDDGLAPARFIHVAPPPAGSNSTGDGSAERPYGTIGFAVARATPGTAVRLGPGAYPGGTFLTGLAGTADAPVWIGGTPGAVRPVIEGGTEGLHLVRCSYVVLHDMEVRGASGNGVNSDDGGEYANPLAAHHQVFRSLFIRDIGGAGNQDGLKLSGVYDFVVAGCEITRCGGAMSGSGIDMVGCHRGVIAGTFMHDLSANAVQAKGGTADVEIRRCRMVNAGERSLNIGGSTGFEFFRPPLSETEPNAEARRIFAFANVIVGSSAPVAFVGAEDCVVAHNTIIEPRTWIFRILQETTSAPPYTFVACSNNTFASNLVWFARSTIRTHVNIGGNTLPATFTFANNLWYAYDSPGASLPSLPSPELNGMAGIDPRLLDAASGSPQLCRASPAAGAGRSPAPTPGDFGGACYRDPPTIGAAEIGLPRADFDGDGRLNSQDFFEFLGAFFVSDPRADFDGSGMVDSQDFFDFVGRFFDQC